MILYIVTEEGVYRHRIMGVYLLQQAAEVRAHKVCSEEDGYHTYLVSKVECDEAVEDIEPICYYTRKRTCYEPDSPTVRSEGAWNEENE
jgi:hypothetical protein